MVLSIPSGMVNVVFTLAAGYITSKFRNVQTIVAVTIEGLVLLGCILLWVLPQDKQAGLFAGIYLIVSWRIAGLQKVCADMHLRGPDDIPRCSSVYLWLHHSQYRWTHQEDYSSGLASRQRQCRQCCCTTIFQER